MSYKNRQDTIVKINLVTYILNIILHIHNFKFDIIIPEIKTGGDFSHMSIMCGHQGAGSTYPSLYTDIELNHLREYHVKHPNIPHNSLNPDCVSKFKTKGDLVENFIQSTSRNPEKM